MQNLWKYLVQKCSANGEKMFRNGKSTSTTILIFSKELHAKEWTKTEKLTFPFAHTTKSCSREYRTNIVQARHIILCRSILSTPTFFVEQAWKKAYLLVNKVAVVVFGSFFNLPTCVVYTHVVHFYYKERCKMTRRI